MEMQTKKISVKQMVVIFCVLILAFIVASISFGTISAKAETVTDDKHFAY